MTQLRNPLFAEFYETTFDIINNRYVLNIQRVTPQQKSSVHDLSSMVDLIERFYEQGRALTLRLNDNQPANEVLHWLENNQERFPNIQIAMSNQPACSIPEFFANRKQEATDFIEQITAGYPVIPTLPICGRLPNQEVFYITEFSNKDVSRLSACIDRMYQHYEKCQRRLAENNYVVDSQNMGDVYRLFWFFENRNEQNTSRDIAARFILRSHQERMEKPARDVYRLAIRNQNFELVGGITLNMLPKPNEPLSEQGDIGYFIDPAHTGERYVSSAMDLLLPFYFRTHDVLSLDIVSTAIGQPHDNLKNNLLSQRAAVHFGANQSNEAPPEYFAAGGYIPWCLTKESFCANRRAHVCHVFGRAPKTPELVIPHTQRRNSQPIERTHYLGR